MEHVWRCRFTAGAGSASETRDEATAAWRRTRRGGATEEFQRTTQSSDWTGLRDWIDSASKPRSGESRKSRVARQLSRAVVDEMIEALEEIRRSLESSDEE